MTARGLCKECRGIAATEFALVLPIMLLAWLGMSQLAQLTQASARTTLAAQSLSDLATNSYSSSPPQLTDLVNAATQILAPMPAGNALVVDVVQIKFDVNGRPTALWQCNSAGQVNLQAVPVSLANNLGTAGQYVIMVTVTYTYAPTITGGIFGEKIFTERSFNFPRNSLPINAPC